nr:polysaccharide biosynthesis/export family protein [Chachezhania sediminis]
MRLGVATFAACFLSACGLPSSGPTKGQIYAGSVQRQGDAFVIEVNDRVTRATAVAPALTFSQKFTGASQLTSDIIRPGDTLGLSIWENVDNPLMGDLSPTQLNEVQVDSAGNVFVPYAGRLHAAGNTPEALRLLITQRLEEQTPDPQVEVRRLAGDGSSVTMVGVVGAQGVYPIERSTGTLSSMLAKAGGVSVNPEVAEITVFRGSQSGKVWLQDLFNDPGLDIALRPGDRVLVEEDTRAFTAMGATSSQARVPFGSKNLSALEALARVGGLVPVSSDPTGVFVFRNEPAEIAGAVLGRNDLVGAQRMVYVLNLKEPNGVFHARDFVIRDGDTLYVTEAPFSQWTKSISLVTGSLTPIANVETLTGN